MSVLSIDITDGDEEPLGFAPRRSWPRRTRRCGCPRSCATRACCDRTFLRLEVPLAERAGCERLAAGSATIPMRPDGLNASGTLNGGLLALLVEEAALSAAPGAVLSSLAMRLRATGAGRPRGRRGRGARRPGQRGRPRWPRTIVSPSSRRSGRSPARAAPAVFPLRDCAGRPRPVRIPTQMGGDIATAIQEAAPEADVVSRRCTGRWRRMSGDRCSSPPTAPTTWSSCAIAASSGSTSSAPGSTASHPEILEGRVVTCSRGAGAVPISEWVLARMLAHEKRLPGAWIDRPRTSGAGPSSGGLQGRTLGLVGLGGIGSAIATTAAAFDMDIVAIRRTDAPAPFRR